MFLRLVRLRVEPDALRDFRRFYEERIVPALRGREGCLFASLLYRTLSTADECLSLTLWRHREDAESYEQSGLFAELLEEAGEFLSGAHTWRPTLAEELSEEPGARTTRIVDGYTVEAGEEAGEDDLAFPDRMHLRIVTLRVQPGRFDDLRDRYREEVIPALKEAGCRHAYLGEGVEDRDEVLSVSVWDREEDAIRYELSGKFDELTLRLRDTFSELYQWKLGLGPAGRRGVTGQDLDVGQWRQIAGRKLDPEE